MNRYVVEPGTDGSWLLVDLGEDRSGRLATGRFTAHQSAQAQADTLSELDDVTRNLPSSIDDDVETETLLADYGAKIDAHHNFNHLLA